MKLRAAVCALSLVAISSVAGAQSGNVFVGGGLSNPTGDAGDALKSGTWMTVGGNWNIKSVKGLSLGGEYQMSSMDAKVGSGSTSTGAIFGNVGYSWGMNEKMGWGGGFGLGSMSSKPKGGSSNSEMAWQLWFGPFWNPSPKWSWWISANYISAGDGASKMTMMPLSVGLTWNLGTP